VLAAALVATLLAACEPSVGSAAHGPDRWWPSYGGTYDNVRHTDLADISAANVGSLALAWKFNTGLHGQFETSPIVVDGTLYFTTGPDNAVYALNAATGKLNWRYAPKLGHSRYVFAVNRGVAVAGGRVFYTTLDDQLIALDAHTGAVVWNTRIGDPSTGLSEDAAPLAWSGMVFVGSSGNEYGVRGSYSAYSQKDGKLLWRWWSVAPGWEGRFTASVNGHSLHRDTARERALLARFRDAWKTGGGAVWTTPALSPQEGTIYLSTGNPAPAFNADRRPGDNLYTDCVVALDAHTGKLKWYYQETPHDVWDYDASSPPILFDAHDAAGHRIPAVAEAGKTGWLYVLNRTNGKLLHLSDPFVPQPNVYHAIANKAAPIQPGDSGGAIGPIAYDPALHAAFVGANVEPELGETFPVGPFNATSDEQWKGGDMSEAGTQEPTGTLTSIDTDTGRMRWQVALPTVNYGGPLSANGLVFLGEKYNGNFRAYDAATGKVLWQLTPGDTVLSRFDLHDRTTQLMAAVSIRAERLWRRVRHQAEPGGHEDIHAPPIAYRMAGREYIVIASHVYTHNGQPGGNTIFAFALP
jgi:PQQ-dependent dehydrogenase (methanol/ethanol family)